MHTRLVFVYWLLALLVPVTQLACKTSEGGKSTDGDENAAASKANGAEKGGEGEGAQGGREGEMRTKRFPDPQMPAEKPVGKLQAVTTFHGPMPTGVTTSPGGRVFVNFPRWGDNPRATVAELKDGKPVPYPNAAINELDTDAPEKHLLSVQSVVVGPAGEMLWALDTGSPKFQSTISGGAKLVGIDLESNKVARTIVFPEDVALEKSYLNDVRFDLTRGKAGMAYITDSSGAGTNGIIVVDLASGDSWRRLHEHPATRAEENFLPIVEGQPLMRRPKDGEPSHMTVGSDGIAIGAEGERLYFRPLSGRGFYSVSLQALSDRKNGGDIVAQTLKEHGDLGFASDGLEADDAGRIYLTNYEDNAVMRWTPGEGLETLVHHPQLLWPDTLALTDGWLYVTANQLHRQPAFHVGKDMRKKPYVLFRLKVDARPVRLK